MKRRWVWCVAAMFVLAGLVTACNPEEDEDETTADEAIAKGKAALEIGDGVGAAKYFRYAQASDLYNRDADYGLVMANLTAMVNLVDSIVPLAPLFEDGQQVNEGPSVAVGDHLQSILETSAVADFRASDEAFERLEPVRPLRFDLGRYPWTLGGSDLLVLGGEFDRADLDFFGALTSLVLGVLDIVATHNLDLNLGTLTLPSFDFAEDPAGTVAGLRGLLGSLLDDPYFDDFLMMEEDGAARMRQAGVELGTAFDRLYRMFNELTTETDDQSNDAIWFADDNDDGRYTRGSDRVFLGELEIRAETADALAGLFHNLSLALWEGSSADPSPLTTERLSPAMLNDLLVALGVLDAPILPDWIGFDIGQVFSDPHPAGLRGLVQTLVDILAAIEESIQK
ncbi:MAG: hypothetical protein IT350_04640 [Deltaproteobacteria bacterium]|nr:hypothetical protein [Deltaproteobacteria bacterium]